jgi:hypothetical protein
LLLAACGAKVSKIYETEVSEIYEAVLPAASGGGERHIRVTLRRDGFAAVSSAFSGRPSRFLAEGTWQREDGRIAVNLHGEQRMLFRHAGEQLVSVEWDHALWGEAGPGVLVRVR